jgi:hypothetical protein
MYSAKAQDALLASGANATGINGSASYSIGQISQNLLTGSGGSIIQGIQFFIESETLTIVDVETNLVVTTYPNPTTNTFNVKVSDEYLNNLSYKLFSISGQLIKSGVISNSTTNIDIEQLPNTTYLLTLNDKNKQVKSFKIIKN